LGGHFDIGNIDSIINCALARGIEVSLTREQHQLTRDDLMVLEHVLTARIEYLDEFLWYAPHMSAELEQCERIRAVLNAEIDRTYVEPCP
jgi:hypothetical protein